MAEFTLETLDSIIQERISAPAGESYTASLKAKGINKCAEKLGEEATEAVIAAVTKDAEGLRGEAADVLYHLLVVLAVGDVSLASVMDELARRTGQTGLEEKASRG